VVIATPAKKFSSVIAVKFVSERQFSQWNKFDSFQVSPCVGAGGGMILRAIGSWVQGEQLLEKNPAPPAFLCCSRILVVRGHQQMHLLANIEWRPFDSAVGSADNRFWVPDRHRFIPWRGRHQYQAGAL